MEPAVFFCGEGKIEGGGVLQDMLRGGGGDDGEELQGLSEEPGQADGGNSAALFLGELFRALETGTIGRRLFRQQLLQLFVIVFHFIGKDPGALNQAGDRLPVPGGHNPVKGPVHQADPFLYPPVIQGIREMTINQVFPEPGGGTGFRDGSEELIPEASEGDFLLRRRFLQLSRLLADPDQTKGLRIRQHQTGGLFAGHSKTDLHAIGPVIAKARMIRTDLAQGIRPGVQDDFAQILIRKEGAALLLRKNEMRRWIRINPALQFFAKGTVHFSVPLHGFRIEIDLPALTAGMPAGSGNASER